MSSSWPGATRWDVACETFHWLPLATLCLVIGVSLVICGGTVHLYIAVALFAAAVLFVVASFQSPKDS